MEDFKELKKEKKNIMNNKKVIICIAFITILLAFILFFTLVCFHEWQDANCTKPITCIKCEKTQGEPLGHKWIDATCTEAEYCSECGEKRNEAKGHTLKKAELKYENYVKGVLVYTKKCAVCDCEIENFEKNMTTLHNGNEFKLTPYSFYQRLENEYEEIDDEVRVRQGAQGSQFVCGCLLNNKREGVFFFKNEGKTIADDEKFEASFDEIYGFIYGKITNTLIALIKTCDPSIDFEKARSVAFDIIVNGQVKLNGITYKAEISDGSGLIWIDIDK